MRKAASLLAMVAILFLLGSVPARAQSANFLQVTASHVQNASGTALSSGTISFQGTDANNNVISYQAGGGGAVITTAVTASIVNGVITSPSPFLIANPANTSPANVRYHVQILQGSRVIANFTGVNLCAQGAVCASGFVFNFDNCVSSGACVNTPLPQIFVPSMGPAGPAGPTGPAGSGGSLAAGNQNLVFAAPTLVTTASDNFNRANGSLGANWTTATGSFFGAAPTITSNQVVGNTSAVVQGAYYTGSGTPNCAAVTGCWAQVTVPVGGNSASGEVGVTVMGNGANGYTFAFYNGQFRILDTGMPAVLVGVPGSVSSGDILLVTASVSSGITYITGYQNGTQVIQTSSASYTTGTTGIFVYGNASVSVLDNFVTGTFSNPAPIADSGINSASVSLNPPSANLCYAATWGNDSNTGLSWGQALLHAMACYDQLPATGGTIFISDNGAGPVPASSISGCGIWIMGSGDPNYSSPPTCWRQTKTGGVHFIGVGGDNNIGTVQIAAGGSADNLHPAFWFSGTNVNYSIEHLSDSNFPNVGVIIGCNSNFQCSDSTGGASGVDFIDSSLQINGVAGAGPNVRIGSNSFWIRFLNSAVAGNFAETITIATLARASNVVTVTTSSAFTVTQYEHLGIENTSDPSFGGSFQVASVIDSTHFTIANIGANVSATSFGGVVVTDKAIPIDIDPWNGNTQGSGSGLVWVSGQLGGLAYHVGGVRLWPGQDGGGAYVDHIDVENYCAPGLWIASGSPPINGRADSIEMSDSGCGAIPAVENDGDPSNVVITRVDSILGPANFMGNPVLPAVGPSALRRGLSGIYQGLVLGQVDAGRRLFSPSALPHGAQFLNTTNPAGWVTLSGTLTTGITAPDGTTGAGQIAGSGGQVLLGAIDNFTPSVGDTFIAGGWFRSATNNGFEDGVSFTLGTNANGFPGVICASNGQGEIFVAAPYGNDGQWIYQSAVCKVIVANASGVDMNVQSSSSQSIQIYAPALLYFPDGTITDNEAYEIANGLSAIGSNCPSAGVCMMPGQSLGVSGSTQFMGMVTHSNTANRTYSLPDASGPFCLHEASMCGPANTFTALVAGSTITWATAGTSPRASVSLGTNSTLNVTGMVAGVAYTMLVTSNGFTLAQGTGCTWTSAWVLPGATHGDLLAWIYDGTYCQVVPPALQLYPFSALTDGATVSWNTAGANNATLLFTAHSGSRTLNVSNLISGGSYVLKLTQDSTGGEGLTLGTGCTWKVSVSGSGFSGSTVTPVSAANGIDVLAFTYDGSLCLATFN